MHRLCGEEDKSECFLLRSFQSSCVSFESLSSDYGDVRFGPVYNLVTQCEQAFLLDRPGGNLAFKRMNFKDCNGILIC